MPSSFAAMVLGVGHRLLRDPQDIEDVFQAAFLVLARKAATRREKDQLASWLYGATCRLAVDKGQCIEVLIPDTGIATCHG